LIAVAVSACTQAPATGEQIADLVVSRETDWGVNCVALGSTTQIYAEDENGPPGMPHVSSFHDATIRAAASAIQIHWRDDTGGEPVIFGEAEGDRCVMHVGRPRISGNFAFVWFSEPGGERGIYAFRRSGGEWQVAERALLGWW
jgi:hypothetical protein